MSVETVSWLPCAVIPGRCEAPNPEFSSIPGLRLTAHPGMTEKNYAARADFR